MQHRGAATDTTVCSEAGCDTVLSRYRPPHETLCFACREKRPLPNPYARGRRRKLAFRGAENG